MMGVAGQDDAAFVQKGGLMATFGPVGDWTRVERNAARAILREPSPYETDGGELIGRDPRKVPVEDYAKAGVLRRQFAGRHSSKMP